MTIISASVYQNFLNGEIDLAMNPIILVDTLDGFDSDLHNPILDYIALKKFTNKFYTQYYLDSRLKHVYKEIDIKFDPELQHQINFKSLSEYNIHPEHNFKNFICSFNGTKHISRKLLVSVLNRFNWFDAKYCSKNFSYSTDALDGHLTDYIDNISFYRKFFISDNSEDFFQTINSFGHVQYQHDKNIYNLESRLTESFLHIVSETLATSYYPYVTEKFLYSIVTRGLFLAYAQPGWHDHVEKYYGFKKYTKLFDYHFDTIQNPVKRLVELITMVSKFSILSPDEWKDLYLLEQDTIEYNYDHYFSGNYLKTLQQHA
jgi:hypothetical protein